MRTKWVHYLAVFLGLLILLRWAALDSMNGQGLSTDVGWIIPFGSLLSMILGGAVGGICMVWTGDHLMRGWECPRAPLCGRLLENAFCFFIGGTAGGAIGGAVAGAAFGLCLIPIAPAIAWGGMFGMWLGAFGGMPAGLAYGLFRGALGGEALPAGSGPALVAAVGLFEFGRFFLYPGPSEPYFSIALFGQILLLSALILMTACVSRRALLRWWGRRHPLVGDPLVGDPLT